MQISELIEELAALFPEFSKDSEPVYRRALKEGPELREALTRTLTAWKKSRPPLPADIAANYRDPRKKARGPSGWTRVSARSEENRWDYKRKLEEHWKQKFGSADPDVPYTKFGRTVMLFAESNRWIWNLSDVMKDRIERYVIEKAFDDLGGGDLIKLKAAHDALAVTQADIDAAIGRYETQSRYAHVRGWKKVGAAL